MIVKKFITHHVSVNKVSFIQESDIFEILRFVAEINRDAVPDLSTIVEYIIDQCRHLDERVINSNEI